MRHTVLIFLVALAVVLPARAQSIEDGNAVLALLPLGDDERAQGEQLALLALLGEELEQRAQFAVRPPEEMRAIFDGAPPRNDAQRETLDELEELLRQVRRHYQFLEVDQARRKLALAEDLLLQVQGVLTSPRLLVEFALLQALVHLLQGDRDAAVGSLAEAAALDPGFELSDDDYPPDVVAAFREGQEQSQVEAPGQLRLTASPAHVVVIVDGLARGRTPRTLDLPPGRHLIRGQRRGCLPQTAELRIESGEQVERELSLVEVSEGDELDLLDTPVDPLNLPEPVLRSLAGWARSTGATYLLLARADPVRGGSQAWLFSVPEARFWTRSWRFSGSGGMFDDQELSDTARDVVMAIAAGVPDAEAAAVTTRPPDPGVEPTPDEGSGDGWWKTWWFWGIVGGVVVGTAVGVTVWAVLPEDTSPTATILVEER